MSALAGVTARLLAQHGRAMTYQRRTAPAGPLDAASVRGYLRSYTPEQIAGLIQQGDAQVTIGPSILPISGAPRANDRVVVDGAVWQVMGATPRHVGAVLDGWDLHVRGGGR